MRASRSLACAPLLLAGGCVLAAMLGACSRHESGPAPAAADVRAADEEPVLNVYNWTDYIDPALIPAFEKESGIKVNYDVFDANVVLETKLLAGRTGYDLVVPTAPFLQRQIAVGVYQKLDKSLLPNLRNLDADLTARMEPNDPGNQYAVIYFWGTSGVGYNAAKIAAAMPNAPTDSLAMIYDPSVIRRFKDCGVSILDAPDEVLETVLLYLGKDPNSESLADLRAAEQVLRSIRPFLRYIHSSRYIADLAGGEICMALLWSGDYAQARLRARETGTGARLDYILPKEGSMIFFDVLAIPADAAHPRNAHRFIDYLLRPEVSAKNSSAMHFPTANQAAYDLVDPEVYHDPAIYPQTVERARLHPMATHSLGFARELSRMWTRFKTGQ
ncbi:MAG TPA: polyamine ABC transporter substrate-binding protein [Steroidobacteraceae bacterium]|jgi:putrescine transport system substrate-binding protein|nr:polyamine ABC transporter substrate-binding protein [Steroidobacteraceae bacterium]